MLVFVIVSVREAVTTTGVWFECGWSAYTGPTFSGLLSHFLAVKGRRLLVNITAVSKGKLVQM